MIIYSGLLFRPPCRPKYGQCWPKVFQMRTYCRPNVEIDPICAYICSDFNFDNDFINSHLQCDGLLSITNTNENSNLRMLNPNYRNVVSLSKQ